ncbi:hypothetical protein TNCV_5071091 [Trichonephila clavipes]|nr:hypothetical protein TNCV_5071091 [Trichonephila clavipes]
MDLEELHFADDSADEPYEIILLPETSRKIAPENRLSPAHACLPLKADRKVGVVYLLFEWRYRAHHLDAHSKLDVRLINGFLWAKMINYTDVHRENTAVYGERAITWQDIVKWC